MELVENFVFRKGRPPKYDWDTLLDGNTRLLKRGKDFDIDALSFRVMFCQRARARNLSASTRLSGDALVVQAKPRGQV